MSEVLGDPRVSDPAWFAAEGIQSLMVLPLVVDGEPVGVMSCQARARRQFTDADLALAAAVAAPAAVAA